jgi:peptide/nickel transport system substrate-binding protein
MKRRLSTILGGSVALMLMLSIACGGDEAAPAAAPAAAPTAKPAPTATPKPVATAKPAIADTKVVVLMKSLGRELWLYHFGGSEQYTPQLAMYDELAVWTPEYQEGRVAEKWNISGDFTSMTVNIRKGIKFHNGADLTSEDVVGMYELTYDKSNSHGGLKTLKAQFGDTVEDLKKNVVATDANTVTMTTSKPYPHWEGFLGRASVPWYVADSSYVKGVGPDEAAKSPIGSGSFKFVKHTAGESILLEAVEKHWRKTPNFRQLEFQIVPEYATQLALLASKRGDLMAMSVDQTKQAKRLGLRLFVDNTGYNVWYNLRGQFKPGCKACGNYDATLPWVDGDNPESALKVRKALNLAIDRNALVKNLYGGQAKLEPVGACNSPSYKWDKDFSPYPYDVAEAKKLLAEAGYKDGFEIDLAGFDNPSGPVGQALHEAIAGYWNAIGVKATVKPMQYPEIRTALIKINRLKLSTYFWCALDEPDPAVYYNSYFGTGFPLWYGSDAFDKIRSTMSTVTGSARDPLIISANKYMYDGYRMIPLFVLPKVWAVSERVDEWPFIAGILEINNFEYMTLK